MFGSKKEKEEDYSDNHTLIARGTKVIGDVHFVGELQVEGKVIGNVISEGKGDSRLVVHEKGVIEGEVRVPSAVVNGDVRGDVKSTGHIELASNAVVQGNVYYCTIEMVKGSQVNGSLVHYDEKAENKKKVESIHLSKNPPQAPPPAASN